MADDGWGDEEAPAPRTARKSREPRASTDEGAGGGGSGSGGGSTTEANPFGSYILMENLYDKLMLLNYDEGFCQARQMPPIGRHYFATAINPSEQLWYFSCLMSWLLELTNHRFAAPDQYEDPNTITTNIMLELRKLGLPTEFSQSKIKQGWGEEVCHTLNNLAQMALKARRWKWEAPVMPREADAVGDAGDDTAGEAEADAMELQAGGLDDDDIIEEDFEEDDGAFIDTDATKDVTSAAASAKAAVLESSTTHAEWKLELERVLPQLKVHIRADAKDWRNHLDLMRTNKADIETALSATTSHLNKLQAEISKTLEKVGSREKYINSQLGGMVEEYRAAQDTLAVVNDKYKTSSVTINELSSKMSAITEELEAVKAQMDERGTSMTDAGPLVKIKQSLTKLKSEIRDMDLRIGVVQHILLSAKEKHRGEMVQDMHADPGAADPFAQPDW